MPSLKSFSFTLISFLCSCSFCCCFLSLHRLFCRSIWLWSALFMCYFNTVHFKSVQSKIAKIVCKISTERKRAKYSTKTADLNEWMNGFEYEQWTVWEKCSIGRDGAFEQTEEWREEDKQNEVRKKSTNDRNYKVNMKQPQGKPKKIF